MDKVFYPFFILILFYTNIQAQSTQRIQYVDVIYFKDGSSVRGIIVYQVPKVRVSIQQTNIRTQTDSVYTYPLANIEKIVKEPASGMSLQQVVSTRQLQAETRSTTGNPNTPNFQPKQQQSSIERPNIPQMTGLMPDMIKHKPITQTVKSSVPTPVYNDVPTLIDGNSTTSNEIDIMDLYQRANDKGFGWYRNIRGLRIFTDYAYTHGLGSVKNNRFEWASSLGFQFDPIFYLGMGISYSLTLNKKESSAPVFINPRINFLDNDITPFFDFKGGYSLLDGKGWYFSPSAGVSFGSNSSTKALSIGLGYTFQQAKYKKWSADKGKKIRFKDTYSGIQLKITYEFNIYTIK